MRRFIASTALALLAAPDCAPAPRNPKVALETLKFEHPSEQQRFSRARACFVERTRARTWRHFVARKLGNFVQEDWCRSSDAVVVCDSGEFREGTGNEWYQLSTTFYEQDWPNVLGVDVAAGRLPQNADWGVRFYYSSRGSMSVDFVPVNVRPNAPMIALGGSYYYRIEQTLVTVGTPVGNESELELLIASPDSLRDTALARFDALWFEVSRVLEDDGVVRKLICKPTKLPDCESVPLSAAELEAARARAKTDFAAYRETVQRWATEFHRILTELMQFERCW